MGKTMRLFLIALTVCMWTAGVATAKVSKEEAAKLGIEGTELTPLGAVRAGNADGTIPAWTGGITKPPAGYKVGDRHPDPFAADQVLFTITAKNYKDYADKLTPGQMALFEAYPETFIMKVYPTRRSGSYPERVYEALMTNAENAYLDGRSGVKKTRITSPFPIPKEGLEVIWNHLMRYRGTAAAKFGAQAAPQRDGKYTLMEMLEEIIVLYADEKYTYEEFEEINVLGKFLQYILTPPRLAGTALLVHETVDQIRTPRNAWTYNAGQRRVRRAPQVAYDSPGTASDGLRTTDDWDIFNGAPDRYKWTLIGKKELIVPYNCYRLHSGDVKYDDIIKPGHINPDLVRYELHRVWHIEANLIDTFRHLYKKRVFYLDEDSWQICVSDIYDNRDSLWRVVMGHIINFYENPIVWTTLDVFHDLQAGRYLAVGLDNETKPYDFTVKLSESNFTPGALRRSGLR